MQILSSKHPTKEPPNQQPPPIKHQKVKLTQQTVPSKLDQSKPNNQIETYHANLIQQTQKSKPCPANLTQENWFTKSQNQSNKPHQANPTQ